MKVFVVETGAPVPPFNDAPGEVIVLGRRLIDWQKEEVEEAGLEWATEVPVGERYILASDRTWFTRGTLARLAEVPAGRLRVAESAWRLTVGPLQDLTEPDTYELAVTSGEPTFEGLEPVDVQLGLVYDEAPPLHRAMAHAVADPAPVSENGVLQIDHWVHILLANRLAMAATIHRERRKFDELNVLVKIWKMLGIWLRAGFSLRQGALMQALTSQGKNCRVHPTAILEGCVLGDDVTVGPYAVVRGSVLRDGVVIDEHAVVNGCVLGDGARVDRRGMINLCVLYPGAHVSNGWGLQFSVFGREAFTALSAMIYDLSFKDPIKVMKDGERVSTGLYFLGAAIGHRAILGGRTVLGYGAEVPNDATLVGPAHEALRIWEEGPGPHRVVDGRAKALGRQTQE
ncbi:MAG: hypothetical protein GY913_00915 [Proteobacteria bacterium]|nr:hypothetical protein [Pseudomonadota bacterium]MCP4915458.1 hypothetical protein [Pseudomonadota bacterium]